MSLTAMLALWFVLALLSDNPRAVPGPGAVWSELVAIAASGELWFHAGMTLFRVLASFVLPTAPALRRRQGAAGRVISGKWRVITPSTFIPSSPHKSSYNGPPGHRMARA